MKRRNIIILALMLIIIPLKVNASENVNLTISCSDLNYNEINSCTLSANLKEGYSLSGADILLENSNLEINEVVFSSNFGLHEYEKSTNKIIIASSKNLDDNIKLLTFKLKPTAKEDVKLTLKNVSYSICQNDNCDLDESEKKDVTFNFKINNTSKPDVPNIMDADSSLKDLSIKGLEFNNQFSSDKYEYFLETTEDTIDITAQTNSLKAKVIGDGVKALKDGDNKFVIVVTSENGNISRYTINVKKVKEAKEIEKSNIKNPKTGIYSLAIMLLATLGITSFLFISRKKLNILKKL